MEKTRSFEIEEHKYELKMRFADGEGKSYEVWMDGEISTPNNPWPVKSENGENVPLTENELLESVEKLEAEQHERRQEARYQKFRD